MAKNNKNIIYSDIFENLDIELGRYLRKCDNGKSFHAISADEKEKTWRAILNVIKSNNVPEPSNEHTQTLKYCTELILSILSFNISNAEKNSALLEVIKYLISDDLIIRSPILINNISKINEHLLAKTNLPEEIPEIEYFTLNYLLELCTSEKPLLADLQRLNNIRKGITSAPFEKMVPLLKPLLIKLIQVQFVINSEHGQRFIAQALLLSPKIMTEIHKTIALELSTCNKKNATDYGRIYIIAWQNACNDNKIALQKTCFQNIMEIFLKEKRTSLDLTKYAQNILQVLEVWHSERKKNCPGFVTMITNAYQPILWKHLQSGFNVHRCNAADVFFKAFPLVRTDDDMIESEKLFKLQYDTMLNCLSDDCHIVRIIAIREVCNIISHYWNSFNSNQILSLMSVITKECARDASSAEVRKMVYVGLQSLVKSSLSCDYIKQILPILSNNIHDVNQKVRIAFIQLLICIKDKKDPTFKYTDVVSMANIQYRLAEDNAAVGQWIVKLLLKNYYSSKMSVEEWTKRFIYLIKTYKRSYRNFFFYSNKSLPLSDAFTIIYEILTQLGLFVLSKYEVNQENDENIVEKPKPKKKGQKKVPLSSWNNKSERPSKVENSGSKKWAFDDPEIVQGLFDIVTILWVLHDLKLQHAENEEMRLKLFDTYLKYAQPFINYYKDCNLFLSVLSLSGNIPASLLRNNSITLPGYCIKMLKSINIEKCDENNENVISMLIALVKWGRGAEIIEQVSLWLDAAFETKNMNETILPRRRVKITETIEPNSVAAIYILDTLLKKEYVKLSILKKNYLEVFRLWKFMSRVKNLIETRLEQGEPFEEELVSDQFLTVCLKRYLKLIPLLREYESSDEEKENGTHGTQEEGFISRQKEMEVMIDWAENLLFPLLQQEELADANLDLIVRILEDVLYVADNTIIIHIVNNQFYFKVAYLALKLISTKYGVYFVNAISRVTVALNQSAKLLFEFSDDLKIFSKVIPSLLSHTLNALTRPDFSPKEIEKIERDLPQSKLHFSKILATYQDNLKTNFDLKEKARQLKLVVGLFADCIISIVAREMTEDQTVALYSNPSQLPPISNLLFTLFYNKKTWTPLFIHVLNTKCASHDADVKTLMSCLAILHLYALGDKKANQIDIEKGLSSASKNLINRKENINRRGERNIEELVETETELLNNHLRLQESSLKAVGSQENTSKEVLPLSGEESVETSLTSFASHTEKNNLEEAFIDKGFEFVKAIENILKTKSADMEDSS